jgi:hypothetical protein
LRIDLPVGYLPKAGAYVLFLQVWLQEFSWTEGDEEAREKQQRASSLPPDSLGAVEIHKEPMFVLEVRAV